MRDEKTYQLTSPVYAYTMRLNWPKPEPYRSKYDGDKVVSWKDCAWQPKEIK